MKYALFRDGVDQIRLHVEHAEYDAVTRAAERIRELQRTQVAETGQSTFIYTYMGGVLYSPQEKYEKIGFDDMAEADLDRMVGGLRCRDVRNLFLGGRDLSASHVALGSARVMGTCAVMGQGVAAAVAVCRETGKTPDELTEADVAAIQQQILKDDGYIPFVKNEDPPDLGPTVLLLVADEAVDSLLRLVRCAQPREHPLGWRPV